MKQKLKTGIIVFLIICCIYIIAKSCNGYRYFKQTYEIQY